MFNIAKGFKQSVTGANTSIFPIVVIDSSIYISTHEVSLNNNNFDPVLLNIPTITERLNIESKKQTISNVMLQISNLPVLEMGRRFSDFGDMRNKDVKIYFCSNNTTNYQSGNVIIDDNQAVLVYQGFIVSSKMDTKLVSLTVEDSIAKDLTQELPLSKHTTGDYAMNEKNKNKPLPYVFGEVDRSPAYLMTSNYSGNLPDDNAGKIIIGEAEDRLDNSMEVLKAFPEGTYNGFDTSDIGVSTIYILKDNVYLNLNMYDPHPKMPKKKNEDGVKILEPFSSWVFDDANCPNHKWRFDKNVDDSLYRYIESYNNQGYYFRDRSAEYARGKSFKFNIIPVAYINSVKSVEPHLRLDGEFETESSGNVEPITINGSSLVESPERTAQVLKELDFGAWITLTGYIEVGIEKQGFYRKPSSVAFKITMDEVPDFPCKTFVLTKFKVGDGEDITENSSSWTNKAMMIGRTGQVYFTGSNYEFNYRDAKVCIWDDVYNQGEDAYDDDSLDNSYLSNLFDLLTYKSVWLNIGGDWTGNSDRKWMVSPETTVHRLMNNDKNQHRYDNVSEGTDKMLDWGDTYDDTYGNSIILSNTANKADEEGDWDNISKCEYMGGMGFTNSSKFNTLYMGYPYHIWKVDPLVHGDNYMSLYYYRAYFAEDASGSPILDEIDTSYPVLTLGEPSNKFKLNLHHFQLLHQGFIENWDEQDYYIKAVGRNAEFPSAWRHTFDLVNMLDVELGDLEYSASNINFFEEQHQDMKIGFTLHEKKPAIDILTEIFLSTKSFFKIDSERKMVFPTIASAYTDTGEATANTIFDQSDVLTYQFSKTKKIYNKCKVKFSYNYGLGSYRYVTETFDAETYITDYSAEYYNIIEDKVLEFESKYIRDIDTANLMGKYLMFLHCNEHNVVKVTTPISKSIQLETGDVIAFDEELDNMKLYGMKYAYKDFTNSDYTEEYKINGQYAYPLWFITKIKKDTTKATIEAIQLHHLSFDPLFWESRTWNGTDWLEGQIQGCTIDTALNYNPSATENDGSCIFPDQDDDAPIVDLVFKNYNTGSTIENGDYIELTESNQNLEIVIQNNSYDPDDLQGTGYDSIIQIPNFSGTQTSNMYFQYALLINNGSDGFELNLQQEGIGDTWINSYGTANPPHIVLTTSVDDITYDENLNIWKIPLNGETDPALNNAWTYSFGVNAYDSAEGTEPINTEPFYIAFQVKSFAETVETSGDINGDGILNVLDIVLLVNLVLGNATVEDYPEANINGDGVLNILDVVILVNLILG